MLSRFLTLSMLLFAACTAAPPMPSSSSLRYLALGDSYTIGESVSASERFPAQLAASLHERGIPIADPEIVARTGWTTDELSSAIDAADPHGPFALVTLLIGVNNQYRGRDAEQYRGEYRALLLRAIAFAGGDPTHVVAFSIPDWGATPFAEGRDRNKIGAEIDRYNAINREETAKAGARYVDITPISRRVSKEPALAAGDGLHPSAEMYREWVEAAVPEVVKALGH
jgi:lysophospholipase L1-like esterase